MHQIHLHMHMQICVCVCFPKYVTITFIVCITDYVYIISGLTTLYWIIMGVEVREWEMGGSFLRKTISPTLSRTQWPQFFVQGSDPTSFPPFVLACQFVSWLFKSCLGNRMDETLGGVASVTSIGEGISQQNPCSSVSYKFSASSSTVNPELWVQELNCRLSKQFF